MGMPFDPPLAGINPKILMIVPSSLELGDKTQSLADDAEDFASLAKQLRKQSEKGIFGGLF